MNTLYHWVGFVTMWANAGPVLLLAGANVRDRLVRQDVARRLRR